jgi:hypothetical protein
MFVGENANTSTSEPSCTTSLTMPTAVAVPVPAAPVEVHTRYTSVVQEKIAVSPTDGQGLGPIVTHMGKSLPFQNPHTVQCQTAGPSRAQAYNRSSLLSQHQPPGSDSDESHDETFVKHREQAVPICQSEQSRSSSDSSRLEINLEAEGDSSLKLSEDQPLMTPDPINMSFRNH